VGAEFLHVGGPTAGETYRHDAANSPFRNFANASKNKVSISPLGGVSLKMLIPALQIYFFKDMKLSNTQSFVFLLSHDTIYKLTHAFMNSRLMMN
jgi:hypothetical protein